MIADPVPPAPRPLVYRSTLVAFAFVLCAHAAIAWWLLGAKFSHEPSALEEPLFVMVVADGVDDPGGAAPNPEGATNDQAEHAPGALAASQSEQPQPALATSEPLSGSPSAQTTPEPVAIAVDKSVQNQLNNSVDKPDLSPEAPVQRAAPASRKEPVRAPGAVTKSPMKTELAPATTSLTAEVNPVGSMQASAASTAGSNPAGGTGTASGPRRIVRPDYLDGPPTPAYPQSARSRRQQGKVIVRVVISPTGLPSSIDVFQSSGVDSLDRAALDAVRRARFRPYAENGIAFEAMVDIPFDFVLRN